MYDITFRNWAFSRLVAAKVTWWLIASIIMIYSTLFTLVISYAGEQYDVIQIFSKKIIFSVTCESKPL